MSDDQTFIAQTARRHGLSEDACRVLWEALRTGGGVQAQFSHPDLGGMGQWSSGMLQIGDMFNAALKARVAGACADLAGPAGRAGRSPAAGGSHPSQHPSDGSAGGWTETPRDWWPSGLGAPAATGSQNATAYALFPDQRRLAIRRDGRVSVFDTGDHRIAGFSQQQSGASSMAFTSQIGTVYLDELRRIEG